MLSNPLSSICNSDAGAYSFIFEDSGVYIFGGSKSGFHLYDAYTNVFDKVVNVK